MCLVICVLNDQLLEWPGQFMETMKDSWILTIDHTQVYCPSYQCKDIKPAHTHTETHTYTHTYTHTHTHIQTHAHTHTHTCAHTYTHIQTHTHTHTHTYTHIHTRTHIHTHTHTHIRTHCTYALARTHTISYSIIIICRSILLW